MTIYELYSCDTSGDHKPIAKFESETPFHSFSVGERIDDCGWDRLDGVGIIVMPDKPRMYLIHSINQAYYFRRRK